MDIRIVNTCNNNCLYCLEWSLRSKEKFISKDFLFTKIDNESNLENITFYWWNPLLHPNLVELIKYSYNRGFCWIWLLSNTKWLNKDYLSELIWKWLSTFWIYFNWFNKNNHEIVNWNGIEYEELLENLKLLAISWINIKLIIHLNNLNIKTIARDLIILKEKYWFNNFDIVNYFPFDKPYENREILDYDINENRKYIDFIFKIIKKLNLKVKFVKFSKDFFWEFSNYYDFKNWVLNQIWEEDIERLAVDYPFCLEEKRCKSCFIKDICKFYGL